MSHIYQTGATTITAEGATATSRGTSVTKNMTTTGTTKDMINNIDEFLESCAPQYDVYTYSFTLEQVKHINRALQHYDLVKEIKQLLKETK